MKVNISRKIIATKKLNTVRVFMCVHACVNAEEMLFIDSFKTTNVYLCVCVCERKRERGVCVCVWRVCERERER